MLFILLFILRPQETKTAQKRAVLIAKLLILLQVIGGGGGNRTRSTSLQINNL